MVEKAKGGKKSTTKVAKAKSAKQKTAPTAPATVAPPPPPATPELNITWRHPEEEAASFLRFTGGHFARLLRSDAVVKEAEESVAAAPAADGFAPNQVEPEVAEAEPDMPETAAAVAE